MESFKTNLLLWSPKKSLDAEYEYFLQATTICDRTNYRADGYQIDDSTLAGQQRVTVSLFIKKDKQANEGKFRTPVVHSVPLGQLEARAGYEAVSIAVEVLENDSGQNQGTAAAKKKAQSTVGTTSAKRDDRPTGEEYCPCCGRSEL